MIIFRFNGLICSGSGDGSGPGGGGFSSGDDSIGIADHAGGVKGADPTSSGDPTSQGFGGTVAGGSVGMQGQSVSDARGLSRQAAVANLNGTMTDQEAKDAVNSIGDQTGYGFLGRAASHAAFADQQLEGVASGGLTALGIATGIPAKGFVTGLAGVLGALGTTAGSGMPGDAPGGREESDRWTTYRESSPQVTNLTRGSGASYTPGILSLDRERNKYGII